MARLSPKYEGVGWACCVNSTLVGIIYIGLFGWIVAMMFCVVPLCGQSKLLTDSECSSYFFKNVLGGDISPLVLLFNLLAWVAVFVAIKGGVKALSSVARFSVILPVVILFVLALRGLAYKNSLIALSALFVPDLSALKNVQLWINAFSQVFFSLSILSGIMPAYGSYLNKNANVLRDCVCIGLADFFVSVLSSIVMFTTMYGCSLENTLFDSGIMCAFKIYPVALAKLFGEGNFLNYVFGVLFYLSLALMAFQSAISMFEAFFTPFSEKFKLKRKRCAVAFCVIGCLISGIYSTKYAVCALEVGDHFANYFNILLLGFCECLCLGLGARRVGLAREINRYTGRIKIPEKPFIFFVGKLAPAVSLFLLLQGMYTYIFVDGGLFGSYPIVSQIIFGWTLTAFVAVASVALWKRRA
jgi:NSS family neurotransmitter:Na+ symporter